MTDLPLYMLISFVSSIVTSMLWMRRGNSWSDADHYALVQKYYDAASQLTSMRAELESLREKLDLSEDVRYSLRVENAKLAGEIGRLKQDIERGEDVRDILVRSINGYINLHLYTSRRVVQLQRSLRIARHKEFKRWKKRHRRNVDNWWPHQNPASYHNSISIRREFAALHDPVYVKSSIRESIAILRTLEPYPLP